MIPLGQHLVVPAEPGSDLVLTIKMEIQYAALEALQAALDRTGAVAGSVVVLDPRSGEILAMVNLPAYDPNDRRAIPQTGIRNRAVTDVFEPGSTQKVVTIAGALEAGIVAPDTMFEIPDAIEIQDTVFRDFTSHPSELTVTEIVSYSSNLGTILIGELLGPQLLHSYLAAFGEGRLTGIDFPGEAAGVLRPANEWCLTTCLAGTAIGYHVAVTPLQMALAVDDERATILREDFTTDHFGGVAVAKLDPFPNVACCADHLKRRRSRTASGRKIPAMDS